MKPVNVNADQIQVFVMVNNVGMMINADMNAKNSLTKGYVTGDLFAIQVILSENVISQVMLENIQIIRTVSVGKKLFDKLIEECTEDNDEIKLLQWHYLSVEMNVNLRVQFTLS